MTNKERTSALAAGADNRQETEQERKERYAKMVCKFFASDDGCKKGNSCEARHLPKDKGCKVCGSIKHHTSKCDRNKPPKPGSLKLLQIVRSPPDAADGKNPRKKDKDRRKDKDKQNSRDKPKKTTKKPSGPRAREAAVEEGETSDTQSSTGAMAILHSEEDAEETPCAYATKTNKTPMFVDPAGKAYALVDSGATNVTLNLKHLPAEATLVEMTLASGKVDAYLFLDEVFARDVKTPYVHFDALLRS
eukprot:1090290-Amphidinium_carterae.2